MKSPIVLLALPALLLAACSHTIERETVVEKPVAPSAVVVEKPAVVVQPGTATPGVVVSPAVVERQVTVERAPGTARSCSLPSGAFIDGSLSCQNRYQYKCEDGNWRALNTPC